MKRILLILTLFCLVIGSTPVRSKDDHAILGAIHSDEVRHIMRRLNILLFERERTQLELQRLRAQQLELLVEEAATLTSTASSISTIDSLKHLDEEQQATFNAMAQELYDTVRQLRVDTDQGHHEAVKEGYIRLQETCNTCHLLFRSW